MTRQLLALTSLVAASVALPFAQPPTATVIRNVRIIPIDGPVIENGAIVMDGGKISAVGQNITAPPGAAVVDGAGLTAMPGIVDAEGPSRGTVSGVQGHMRAQLIAGDYFDPFGNDYRVERQLRDFVEWGVTSVNVKLGDTTVFDSVSSVIKVHAPATYEDHFVKYRAALRINLGEPPRSSDNQFPTTRMGIAGMVRQEFLKARDYMTRRESASSEPDAEPPAKDYALEPLVAAMKGELPVMIHAVEPMDIETALRLADEFKFRLVLTASAETLEAQAPELVKRNVPVVLGTYYSSINSHTGELTNFKYETAGMLARKGVTVAFGGLSGETKLLSVNAGMAVQAGMDYSEALKALTINPARILGVDNRLGSLTVGKDADIVLYRGDPLEITSPVEKAWIGGRLVYERSAFDPTYHNLKVPGRQEQR